MGITPYGGKYVMDISAFSDRVRRDYPIAGCLLPEIDLSATEPSITGCTGPERGSTLVQIAHSTVSQMYLFSFKAGQSDNNVLKKIIDLISSRKFYKITLTPSPALNSEFLKSFINNL